jgi:uncharacterized membrane protein
MTGENLLLACHAAATLWMTGLSWFVALVHYPLMAEVGKGEFPRYERLHQRRTSWIAAPVMTVEAALAAWLVLFRPAAVAAWQAAAGLFLVVAIWGMTFFVQIPLHARLEGGFNVCVHNRLVASHWWRTVIWTLRSVLALAWLGGC